MLTPREELVEQTRVGWRRGPASRSVASALTLLLVISALVGLPFTPVAQADPSPPNPKASLDVPDSVLLGESFSIGVDFDNDASGGAVAEGYGPYLDVYLPIQGIDGVATDTDQTADGISWLGSATFLGVELNVIEVVLACDGSDVHPFTLATFSCPTDAGKRDIRTGDVLLVVELPFGSFTASQPPATVSLDLELSELADLGDPLAIYAAAGFRFGADPLDNPDVDPPVVQEDPVVAEVQPTLARLDKTYLGPEDETATGPNYPRVWRVELTVASGQVLTDVQLVDALPPNVAFLAATPTVGTGVIVESPPVATPSSPSEVTASFTTVTGTGGVSAAFDIAFFVPEFDAAGDPVIPPDTGVATTSRNTVSVTGTWEPIDERDDPIVGGELAAPAEHVLTDRSVAIQKSVQVVGGGGQVGPGAELEWTLAFQVSDHFTFDELRIEDVLTDGQSLVASPTLRFTDARVDGEVVVGEGDLASFTTVTVEGVDSDCTTTPDGRILLDIDLSAAVASAAVETNGRLTGGLVTEPNSGPTQGTVTFRTRIDASYRCLDGGQAVDSLDRIGNAVTISGRVVRSDDTLSADAVTDGSAAGVTIVAPSLAKTVYARNGDTGDTGPRFAAGDTITYRLRIEKPLTNFEGVSLTDFLPLPVLLASEFTDDRFADGASAVPPPAGTVSFGPDHDVGLPTPTVTTDAAGNSLTFSFDDVQNASGTDSSTIDLLLTATITSDPFADGLFLTNQARLAFSDSFEVTDVRDEIVQFELTNPEPAIHKGVVATDGVGDFDPADVGPAGPWTVSPTASALASPTRFTEVLTSQGLVDTPLGSDLDGVWAGDLVAFAVVVENTGSGINGAFDVAVTDTIPAGLVPPDGDVDLVDLQVTDGTGTPLTHTATVTASTTGSDGSIEVALANEVDGPGTGALAPFDATSGRNLAVITYVLQVADGVDGAAMGASFTNTASTTDFAAAPGGDSYPLVTAEATVTVADPVLTKSLTGTGQPHTTSPDATIGETATYEVVVAVPPSSTGEVVLRDTLDVGLAFVSLNTFTASPGLSSTVVDLTDVVGGIASGTVPSFSTVAGTAGRQLEIPLGTLTNATDTVQTLTFTTTVVVLNVAANQDTTGDNARRNRVELLASGTRLGDDARAQSLRLVEPDLTVTKTLDPATADAGDTVTFTIVVDHPAGARRADAFDVAVTDTVPTGLTYVDGSFATAGGLAPTTVTVDTTGQPVLSAAWDVFGVGSSTTFTYEAVVDADAVVEAGSELTNTVDVAWTSLPGDRSTSESPFNVDGVERTGAGGVNDYFDDDQATLDIVPTELSKRFVEGSATHTTGTALTIGEVGTFEVTVTLPEGDLGEVVVTDTIPTGLAYVANSLTVDASGFDGVLGTPTVATDGGSGALTVAFDGDGAGVSTSPTTGTAGTTFVLTYDLVVLDVGANVGGHTRENSAIVTVAGVSSDPVIATIELVEPVLSLDKSFDPDRAAANDPVTITLRTENTGTSSAFDLEVVDILDGDVFTDVAFANLPAGWAGDVATTTTGTVVTFSAAGPLATGAVATFEVTARLVADLHENAEVPGTHTNTATATWHTLSEADDIQGERRTGTVTDSEDLELVVPDLEVSKTAPTAVMPEQAYAYTITVTNVGGRDATDVVLVDVLPDSDLLTFDAASNGGVVAPVAPATPQTVTWDIGPLAADGGTVTRTVTFTVASTVPAGSDGTEFVNVASATFDTVNGPDPTPENNSDTATMTLGSTIDVAVTKDGPAAAAPGETLAYTVTVTNVGNEDATGIVVTDTLPTDLTFVAASDGGAPAGGAPGGTVTWTLPGVLPAGGGDASTVTFTVTATLATTVPAGLDAITNTVVVQADGDTNPANDTDDATTTVDAAPVLEVTKTDDTAGGLVAPGEQVVYTIRVANTGDQGATGVVITDTLPAEVGFVAASDGGVHAGGPAGGTVTWTLAGELPAGADRVVTVTVATLDPIPGEAREAVNTVTVTDDGANSVEPATDSDETITRLNVTTLAKALVDTSATHTTGTDVVIGEVATYALTVSLPEGNIGEVVVTDQVPAGMAYLGGSLAVDTAGFAGALGTPTVATDPDGGSSGQVLTVAFNGPDGTGVTVAEDGVASTSVVTLTYDVVVLDVEVNASGTQRTNTATVRVGGRDVTSNEVTGTVVEPVVTIAKTFTFPDAVAGDTPGAAAANDTVRITLSVTNPSGVTAFDLEVVDVLDADVFAGATIVTTPDGWDASVSDDGGIEVRFTGAQLAAGATVVVVFDAVLAGDVPVPGSHTNTAAVTWQSLPGDPDQQREYGPATGSDTLGFVAPDLRVVKEVVEPAPNGGTPQVDPGDVVTYTIRTENVGGRQAVGIVLTDTLPPDTSFVAASDGGTFSGGVVTWPAFNLDAASGTVTSTTRTLTLRVNDPVSADANELINTASAADDGSRGDDPTPANNSDTATVFLDAVVDLTVTKTADTASVGTGGTILYTVTVTSLGNEGADGIVVTDTLPTHTSFVSATGGGTEDGGVVTWPTFDLDGAGGSNTTWTQTVTVRVADTVPAAVNALTNRVRVTHPSDVDPGNDVDEVVVGLDAVPDLAVTKTSDRPTLTVGGALTFTIEVRNVGDQGAAGVTVVDTLPAGLIFVDASHGGVHDDGTVTWDLPDELPAGESQTLTLEVRAANPLPTGTTSLTNTVTVSDDGNNGPDPNPDDNTDTARVTTGADLSVTKTTVVPPVPEAFAVYEVVVANAGPDTVGVLSLVDTLPAGLSDAVFVPETGSYDPVTSTWSGLTLPPGGSVTMQVTAAVSLTAIGEVTNRVTVMPLDHADPDPTNNSDEVTDPVRPESSLSLDKQLLSAGPAGGEATYELTVTNDGPSIVTGIVLVDDLPAGLNVLSVGGEGSACEATDTTARCTLTGTLAPAASASVLLVAAIAPDLSGPVRNSASVGSQDADGDVEVAVADVVFELPEPTDPEEPDGPPEPTPTDPDRPDVGDGLEIIPRTGLTLLRWLLLATGLLGIGWLLVHVAAARERRWRHP